MTKVVRYSDTKFTCWALLEMENGDPCWISVAQSSVVVKKSRIGLFGATLYKESVVYNVAMTAKALTYLLPRKLTPRDMTNPVLCGFTNAALHCSSAAEVSRVTNEAVRQAEHASGQPISEVVVQIVPSDAPRS